MDWMIFVVIDAILLILATCAIALLSLRTFWRPSSPVSSSPQPPECVGANDENS